MVWGGGHLSVCNRMWSSRLKKTASVTFSKALRMVLETIHITVTQNSRHEGTKEHMHLLYQLAQAGFVSIVCSHSFLWERSAASGERICWLVASQGASLTWQERQTSGSWRGPLVHIAVDRKQRTQAAIRSSYNLHGACDVSSSCTCVLRFHNCPNSAASWG